jgi:mRNA interferase RelE/StbE
MSWTVLVTDGAKRDLKSLDVQTASRIVVALERLATGEHGDVKRLAGIRPPQWRLRVGDWRVRFQYDHPGRTIQALRVLHRGEAYR